MAITKAVCLAFANNSLCLEETDIDEQMKCVLGDLLPFNFLEARDTTITLVDGDDSFAVPTDFKDEGVISIVLNDGSVDLAPLLPMPGGYKGYREAMDSVYEGEESGPKFFTYFNGRIYIYPAAVQDYTSIFDYYKKNALDPDNIEYGDEYTNLFKFGAAYYMAMKFAKERYINIWQPAYNNQIQIMRMAHPGQPAHVGGQG